MRVETRISAWIFTKHKDGAWCGFLHCLHLILPFAHNLLPCFSLFPRLLGLPAGLTLTTLPSDRAAWIRLPAGLATCRWSTLRWGSTPSFLKTRSLFWGRNTETLSDFEESSQVGEGKWEGTGIKLLSLPGADPLSRGARLCQEVAK